MNKQDIKWLFNVLLNDGIRFDLSDLLNLFNKKVK